MFENQKDPFEIVIRRSELSKWTDDIIYMLPLGMNKPIKVVMEGNTVSVEKDPLFAADHTYGFTVDMRMGMDAIVGSKIGAITLN